MKSMRQSTANQAKLTHVSAAFEKLLDEVLAAGFHGVARLELVIADGTTQRVSRAVEEVENLH
jgi:hypothetical protein